MANTIDFNVGTNATQVLNQTADAAENAAKGFTSAKAELRALTQQLLQMDSSSEEFKKASARAAELKDNIGDLSAEISANAGNAFEGLSNNVGLFGSRLMDLDLKGAGQALAGMGAAVNKIDFKTLKDEIGGLIQGLGKLAKAVLANPYLMLAAAVALVVANFDTIIKQFPAIEKGLTGINEQERELLELQTKRAEQAKKNYDNISATENTLRLQGKTEKEIRDMKIAAIQSAIQEAKVRLETQRGQEKAQIDTAKKNREILEGVIKFINAPLYLLLSTVDKIASWLGQTTNLAEGLTDLAADLLIDPEQQQADLQKSFEEQENTIRDMENSLAGFRLEQQKVDKEARDKSSKERQDALEKEKDAYEKAQEELTATLEKWDEERIEEERKTAQKLYELKQKEIQQREDQFQELQRLQNNAEENEINDAVLAAEKLYELAVGNAELELKIKEELEAKIAAITKKYRDKEKEETEKSDAEILAAKQATQDVRLKQLSESFAALGALNDAFTKKGQQQSQKQFQIQKALNLASAVVDTYGGINRALNDKTMPSTTARIIQASIVGAMGLANVIKISKTEYGNATTPSGTNMSAAGGSGAGGTTAPSPANFAFLQNQPQQQAPLQAYVVSTQVSSNLEAQQLINNQARLGG